MDSGQCDLLQNRGLTCAVCFPDALDSFGFPPAGEGPGSWTSGSLFSSSVTSFMSPLCLPTSECLQPDFDAFSEKYKYPSLILMVNHTSFPNT